jgi:hypothetical protein
VVQIVVEDMVVYPIRCEQEYTVMKRNWLRLGVDFRSVGDVGVFSGDRGGQN